MGSAVRVLVRGRVQGVGFRFFAQQQARQCGLVGWVRNLADGGVEVVAQGEGAALETLVGRLREGPAAARVATCQVSPLVCDEALDDFAIRP